MEDFQPSERGTKEYVLDVLYDDCEEVWDFDLLTGSSVGDLEAVESLLKHDGCLNVKNSCGWTSLMFASYFGHSTLVVLLLSTKSQNLEDKNDKGRNALMLSAYCGHLEVVKAIVERINDIEFLDEPDPSGWTALFYASAMGHDLVVDRLLEAGADLHHRSLNGENCLSLARQRGHERVLNKIFQHHELATSIFAGPRQATVLLNRRRASLEEANVENLETLLRNLGLEKYYPIFKSNGIELNQFASLSDQELKDLGISLLGPRRKLTSLMGKLKKTSSQN